jgi:hypothetical protein
MIHAMGKLDQQWIEIFRAGDYGEKGNLRLVTGADVR